MRLRPEVLTVSVVLALGMIAGCHSSGSQPEAPAGSVQRVNCWETTGDELLESGVVVKCHQIQEGGFDCELQYDSTHKQVILSRSGETYGLREFPGIVLVRDAYASNEDEMLLVDMRRRLPVCVEVPHTEWETYSHSYYDFLGGSKRGFLVRESQHGADNKPSRSRTLEIFVHQPGDFATGPWCNDEQ